MALLLSACSTVTRQAAQADNSTATFLLVPHAETTADDADDPALSAAGQARALALQAALSGVMLEAIYVDEFRRTSDTAGAALGARPGLKPTRYFSRGPLQDSARQWRSRHPHGTVLIVGEPEAIAPLAGALCDCQVRPLSAGETDRLIRIQRAAGGQAQLDDGHYGDRP